MEIGRGGLKFSRYWMIGQSVGFAKPLTNRIISEEMKFPFFGNQDWLDGARVGSCEGSMEGAKAMGGEDKGELRRRLYEMIR